ncbi:MAG TPA: carboxypeptidase-like regulatory domain-containing protein [Blastocatellia bacterium]|nr:carboxypeptidase-like regulatory domain-containing protein [Blastocatellia bacterium]
MSVWLSKAMFVLLTPVLFIAILVLGTPVQVLAQAGQAELTGEVRDGSGAAVAQATVTITQVETGDVTTAATGREGVYLATNLRPGLYTVAVGAGGFRRLVREGIRLTTGERIRVDLTLTVGSVDDQVTVRSDASLLRTETGSLGQVISNRRIVELPLNGRNFFTLISLVPGVAAPPPTTAGPSFPRINGGRPRVNEYLYDGISALQPEPGQVAFNPVIDAIQEFKVEINSPSAEFGRFNGGVVNLTTRAGTNSLHGTAFEFLRNEALNARNLFAPATAANPNKPVFRRNQYGFAVGGPLYLPRFGEGGRSLIDGHNRTFFFGDFQGTRQSIGRVLTSNVPTVAQRGGNFASSLGAPLFLLTTASGVSATTANTGVPINVLDTNGNTVQARVGQIFRPSDKRAYVGNLIPIADFDPVARTLLARYPLPTSAGAANNYRRLANEGTNQDQFDIRLDHHFSDRRQVFGRYSFFNEDATPVTPLPDGSGNITQGALGLQKSRGYQAVGNFLQVFSPTVVNELRFGYTRRSIDRRALLLGTPPSQSLGLPGIPQNAAFQNELPTFTIAGLQQLGPSTNTDSLFNTDVTQLFDAVGWQRARHSMKFGVDFRIERLNVLQPPSPTGIFNFTAPFSNSRGTTDTLGAQPGGATTGSVLSGQTGNALGSFLLGQVSNFSIDLQQGTIHPRARILEFFAQDDFKATSRLTINAGLRYTLNYPSTETGNQGAVFNLETQQLEYLGRNGFPEAARELHKLNFAPRLGIAYRIQDRTVIRAGYGLIWQEQAGITTPFTIPQFPFIQTVTQRSLDGFTPAFALSAGPNVQPIPLTPDAGLGQGVFSVDRDLGSGYVQQWNLAVQREITGNLVAEVAYAGSKITHVGIPDTNINQLTAAQLAQGNSLLTTVANPYFGQIPRNSSLGDPTIARAQLLRPYPRFTTVSLYRNNVGNTSYHALQAKLEKRFSRGLTFLICYTRSKLIDDAGSVFDASILTGPVANFPVADSFNRALEKDVSTGDIPNVFVSSFTYELPFGKGQRFKLAGLTDKLLGGWSINGTVLLQSGLPFPVTQVTNFNAFAGFGTQRPNILRNPALPADQQTTDRWFDTSAFAVAPQFTIGSGSRNPVRGPAYRTADLAFIKRTYFSEALNFEFRTEIFNLTNTPPLSNPNGVLGNAAFGTITSAGDPRVIQFGLKLNF